MAKIVNGMYVLNQKQKQLLKDLNKVVTKITAECNEDNIFNDFINELGVFDLNSGDLTEVQSILLDNIHEPQM